MINITVGYEDDEERDYARSLVNSIGYLLDNQADSSSNVWLEKE